MKITVGNLKRVIREAVEEKTLDLSPVKEAIVNLNFLNRMTTFSQWYKGEHGRAVSALKRETRNAMKAAKVAGKLEVIKHLKMFLDSQLEKSTSMYHFENAVKALSTNDRESMRKNNRFGDADPF